MEAQDKPVDGMPTPEIIAALLNYARLSHRIKLAASEAPGAMAAALLAHLVKLCKAERGAVLIPSQSPGERQQSFPASAREVKDALQTDDHQDPLPTPHRSRPYRTSVGAGQTLRTLALHVMEEEKALALLEGYASDGPAIQSLGREPCCLICKLPISAPLDHQQGNGAPQSIAQAEPAGTSPAGEGPAATVLPVYALLVLVWMANVESTQSPGLRPCIAAEQAKTLLPWIIDAAGAVVTHVLLVERIHELEAMADRKSLREMELLKAELLATVSHELRSPLASIKGYAATLLRHERRISREERHEFLLAITQASDRLAGVIDRLLEMSQLETGDITIELTAVNLAYLVREAITAVEQHLLAPEHANRPWTLALRLLDGRGMPTGEEPVIWADRHRLREVLDNLLENAIHYSPEGGAIEITIHPIFTPSHTVMPPAQQEVQQMVEICVQDHGIGIPPAHLGRVFDRFHRIDTRLTREVNGLGLGLAISKRIVELHGGTIWAQSDIGQGSAFHVWLPVEARLSQ
jgi:signal transduction histidine kinase